MKRGFALLLCFIIAISASTAVMTADADITSAVQSTAVAKKKAAKKKISKKERNKFYSQSAFIGSSIGVGQRMYFDSKGDGYLGNPKMLVRGCYSFYNDKRKLSKWMITYKGKPMQARYAVKKCKCKRVFIAMGTNDFHGNADVVFDDYVEYLKGIRKTNPKVVIFIESTTSITSSRQGKYLNSRNVRKLNEKMKDYCNKHKDMYFVDVSSKLNDKNGHLKKKYASDNYCHLTFEAYKIWTDELTKYTDKLMLKEKAAEKAVKAAEKSRKPKAIKKAKKAVKALDSSTFKNKLRKRIKKIKPVTTAKATTTTTAVPAKETTTAEEATTII